MSNWTDLHAAIQIAIAEPLEADCTQLCQLMDQSLVCPLTDRRKSMSDADLLRVGGSAIALISEVIFLRMQNLQELPVIEETLEQEDFEGFPMLGDEDDQWERHTMSVDLDEDEEDWGKTKSPRSRSKPGSTAATIPPKHLSKWLKDLAGDDDPKAWSTAISQWVDKQKSADPISLAELQKSIRIQVLEPKKSLRKLSIVELWMGLLLGKFTLVQSECTEEEFYREFSDSSIMLIPDAE